MSSLIRTLQTMERVVTFEQNVTSKQNGHKNPQAVTYGALALLYLVCILKASIP